MLSLGETLSYYKRSDIQNEIMMSSKNREVGVMFNDKFGKRPDAISFQGDVMEFAKKGATSFHFSEELWKDPMQIKNDMDKREVNNLRIGWDLVLDVDFEIWEITKIIADSLIKALRKHGISSVTCKFSGNKGFHIGVPFEAFPEKVAVKGEMVETKTLFPDSTQRIATYLMDYIDRGNNFELSKSISKNNEFIEHLKKAKKNISDVSAEVCGNPSCSGYGKTIPKFDSAVNSEFICEKCGRNEKGSGRESMMKCSKCGILMKKISSGGRKKVCPFCKKDSFINKIDLKIDTILVSSRHLFRGVYSMHEKSGLVSLPIDPESVLQFEKKYANPDSIIVGKCKFLSRKDIKKGEAKNLILRAFDYNPNDSGMSTLNYAYNERMIKQKEKQKKDADYETIKDAVPESFFPPCITNGFLGLKDGKKRYLFVIVNFLVSVGWSYEQIEEYLLRWNKNNETPLREVIIKGQLRYHKAQGKKVLPPNCSNKMYYEDIGICRPDSLCKNVKNPVSYAKIKTINSAKNSAGKK